MNISIQQFKSIIAVDGFSFDGLTLLAGANSSGKSSIIQALLLLKQTLEASSDEVIALQGEYVNARDLSELIYNNSKKGITVSVCWDMREVEKSTDTVMLTKHSSFKDAEKLLMTMTLKSVESTVLVTDFVLSFGKQNETESIAVHYNSKSKLYDLTSGLPNLNRNLYESVGKNGKIEIKGCKIDFLNFFPIFVSSEDEGLKTPEFTLLVMKDMRSFLSSYLRNIYYIGPNRVSPELDRFYASDTLSDRVDSSGSNTRYILAEQKKRQVGNGTLADEVNFWIKQLGLADGVSANKDSETKRYRTSVSMNGKLKVDLCNTGFGNSQILPILVQGLLAPAGSLLIIEDPEVHMHPAVQSAMTDFFIAMAKEGKNIIIETHSDHIVTRIRRRVIETPSIKDMIHICYVENTYGHSEYLTLEMNEQASPLTATKQEAEVLLRKAFIDAQIPEDVIFPERLYTWDSKSNTYIEFRRSSGSHLVNEYHGFDLDKKNWNSVPEYIKNIYHHW